MRGVPLKLLGQEVFARVTRPKGCEAADGAFCELRTYGAATSDENAGCLWQIWPHLAGHAGAFVEE